MATEDFNLLGKSVNQPPSNPEEAQLDIFPNRHKAINYLIEFDCADFTSQCPITSQSDFAKIHIQYIPGEQCIETKSLKYYLQSFRAVAMFNEQIVNRILEDLVEACAPRWIQVKGAFAQRGGISLTTTAEYPDDGIKARIPE